MREGKLRRGVTNTERLYSSKSDEHISRYTLLTILIGAQAPHRPFAREKPVLFVVQGDYDELRGSVSIRSHYEYDIVLLDRRFKSNIATGKDVATIYLHGNIYPSAWKRFV